MLGLPPVIGSSFFPKVLSEFRRKYPHITIQVLEEGGRTIEGLVADGTVDLGVVVLPVDLKQFDMLPLVERKLHLVVHAAHPLASRRAVSLSELKDEWFILFRKGFGLHYRIREACFKEGFEPKIAYEGTQWDFMSELAAADFGITLLPETISEKLDPLRVSVIRETQPGIRWDLGLIWRKDSYVSYAAREWIRFVEAHFQRPR